MRTDLPTLIALSALAYLVAVGMHEHAGHTLACVALGSHPTAAGAFYVDCADQGLSGLGRRLVALAGPAVSLTLGLGSFALLGRIRGASVAVRYLVWLVASLGCMSAAGYPLFSAVTGLGDLGTTVDGALHGIPAEPAARVALFAAGVLAYRRVVARMRSGWNEQFGGVEGVTPTQGSRITLVSYLSGAALYLAIGALNPKGLEIVLTSALPSSLGASYGLIAMWGYGKARAADAAPGPAAAQGLAIPRRWDWIGLAALMVAGYALAFAAG